MIPPRPHVSDTTVSNATDEITIQDDSTPPLPVSAEPDALQPPAHATTEDGEQPQPFTAIEDQSQPNPGAQDVSPSSLPPLAVATEGESQPQPSAVPQVEVVRPSLPVSPVVASQQTQDIAPPPTPAGPTHNGAVTDGDNAPREVFTFGARSTFVTSCTIKYLESIRSTGRWVDMIKAYLRLEQLPVPPGVSVSACLPPHITLTKS